MAPALTADQNAPSRFPDGPSPTPQDLEDHPPFVMAARLKPKTSHDKPKLTLHPCRSPTRTLFYGGRGVPSPVHQDRRQFTLVQHGTDLVWHRSVLVCAWQLVRIVTV
jgi:hypothetical protein